MEIERKWKIYPSAIPAKLLEVGVEINQGYLAVAENGTEVRLRQRGEKFIQTVKSAGDLARSEYEVEVPAEVFEALWPATEGARVEKVRYTIDSEEPGLLIELDVYAGTLEGLVVAEVEFPDMRTSEHFTAPEWFGEEVTTDSNFKNKNLAVKGLPKQ